MKIKIKPWKIKIKRKKQPYGYKKAVREKEAEMKDRKIMQGIRGGMVLLFAILLGVSSFVADYQMCAYAGITESEPEVSVIAETYAETESMQNKQLEEQQEMEKSQAEDLVHALSMEAKVSESSETTQSEEVENSENVKNTLSTETENRESLEQTQSTEAENSENSENTETAEDTQGKDDTEYIAPDVKITIEPQEGWHKDEAVVSVSAEDMLATGNFVIDSVKVKISKNGSWMDITDDLRFMVSENCSVYVMITDKNGATYEKTRYITCFDKIKPVLNAAVNGGLLSVQAMDNDSGVKAVYVNGYEFTELTNGVLNVRLQEFDTGYEYFTIQAIDMAGNMSDVYKTKNIYYRSEEEKEETILPENATPTPPSDAQAEVTEHADESKKEFYTIKTDTEKVFYLVIDKSGESEKVYFLTEVSERDLLNVTSDTMQTLPQNNAVVESAVPDESPKEQETDGILDKEDNDTNSETEDEENMDENTQNTEQSSVKEEPVKKESSSMTVYIIIGIAAAIGIGVGYYVKVYKKKLEAEDEENEVLEDEIYENEDDSWDDDEIADTEDE